MAFQKVLVVAIIVGVSYATDPTQLQDFCPSSNDPTNKLIVNGQFCKNSKDVTAEDFLYKGLDVPLDTNNPFGMDFTIMDGSNFSGLNTLGITIGRADFAPDGLVPPHTHPRATEVFIVMEGTIYVGFVNSQNRLFTKVVNKGDAFVFPEGLLHFTHNTGKTPAYAISCYSSQNPGLIPIPDATFGTQPRISVDTLAKAFQVDADVIKELQSKY